MAVVIKPIKPNRMLMPVLLLEGVIVVLKGMRNVPGGGDYLSIAKRAASSDLHETKNRRPEGRRFRLSAWRSARCYFFFASGLGMSANSTDTDE